MPPQSELPKTDTKKEKDKDPQKAVITLPKKITKSDEYKDGLSKSYADKMMQKFQAKFKQPEGSPPIILPIEEYRKWEGDARESIRAEYDAQVARAHGILSEVKGYENRSGDNI